MLNEVNKVGLDSVRSSLTPNQRQVSSRVLATICGDPVDVIEILSPHHETVWV
jgi:hypothetical protein